MQQRDEFFARRPELERRAHSRGALKAFALEPGQLRGIEPPPVGQHARQQRRIEQIVEHHVGEGAARLVGRANRPEIRRDAHGPVEMPREGGGDVLVHCCRRRVNAWKSSRQDEASAVPFGGTPSRCAGFALRAARARKNAVDSDQCVARAVAPRRRRPAAGIQTPH